MGKCHWFVLNFQSLLTIAVALESQCFESVEFQYVWTQRHHICKRAALKDKLGNYQAKSRTCSFSPGVRLSVCPRIDSNHNILYKVTCSFGWFSVIKNTIKPWFFFFFFLPLLSAGLKYLSSHVWTVDGTTSRRRCIFHILSYILATSFAWFLKETALRRCGVEGEAWFKESL